MKKTFSQQFFIPLSNICVKTVTGLTCAAFLLGNPFPGIPDSGGLGGGQEIQIPENGEQPDGEPGISPQDDFPDYGEPIQ